MKRAHKETLKLFQCEYNRNLEEDFAQTLSERADIRLFFINENRAFTDGQNIVVNPAIDNMFADRDAMRKTEDYLKLPHKISNDPYLALRMITRCQNIHEALHIIYTNFPIDATKSARATTNFKEMLLAKISNIIEDAFIEAAGASVFDNMSLYLMWGRVSRLHANTPSEGTLERAFKSFEINGYDKKILFLLEILNYFIVMLLYPMLKLSKPRGKIKKYIDACKQLFLDGSICGEANERFVYAEKIFDILLPLIPENECELGEELFEKLLGGAKTHSIDSTTINKHNSNGKTAIITRRLFTDLEGNPIDPSKKDEDCFKDEYLKIATVFSDDKASAIEFINLTSISWEYKGSDFRASNIHKNIIIKVEKPKPNLNMKKAYQNIYNKYRININSYNVRFCQLLKGLVETIEDKFEFGNGIASNRLGDIKKRYWYRKVNGQDIPDVAILLLIDGSGSMSGNRVKATMISSVILHEVLKKNRIEHAVVEHRAIYDEPKVQHNILVDFKPKINEKYNLLKISAYDGTREGLSLYWAEKYLLEMSNADHKLIITLSDGEPAHGLDGDGCYLPPVSIKDTANAVRKITKRGTNIVAIALDNSNEDECYQQLKEIYPTVVACNDLSQLTGKLLTVISKMFS